MKRFFFLGTMVPLLLNAWTFIPAGIEPKKSQWIGFGGKCCEECSHPGWHIIKYDPDRHKHLIERSDYSIVKQKDLFNVLINTDLTIIID